jgi:hypothetical protein
MIAFDKKEEQKWLDGSSENVANGLIANLEEKRDCVLTESQKMVILDHIKYGMKESLEYGKELGLWAGFSSGWRQVSGQALSSAHSRLLTRIREAGELGVTL